MDELSAARKLIKAPHDNIERYYDKLTFSLGQRESRLQERLDELNRNKNDIAQANGNPDAADDDRVDVNAWWQNHGRQAIHLDSYERNKVGGVVQWAMG